MSKSTAALVAAAAFVCVIAPVCEEFFFRGFIFGALRRMRIVVAGRDLGTWVAAVITGILFGLAHTGSASSQYLIPLGFLGFVLCLVRWRTASLYPCMALHSINNSLALGVNQLHWNGLEILGLMVGALMVIAAVTGPLSRSSPTRRLWFNSRLMTRRLGPALVALLMSGALAPAALADGGLAQPPAKASVALSLPDAFFVHGDALTVPRRVTHVRGVVRPYVPGQMVNVRIWVGSRHFKTDQLRVKPGPGGRYGQFTEAFSAPAAGIVKVEVGHQRTTAMESFLARRYLASLDERVGFGSTGRFVQLIQQRLAALHFYIPQTGVYDSGTGLAVDAYHRLLHWGTSETLDGRTVSYLLNGWGSFPVRYPSHGKHVEGNLSRQLIALIYGKTVYRIYPISSGKPSTPTILGNFRVYQQDPGYLPDGMYYSSFFIGGYAIHGYNPAPDYPASHGCMRVPIVDAKSIFYWLRLGDRVDVYY